MKSIKYFAIAALALLSANGLQGMLRRRNPEREMRMQLVSFVTQRNIEELNNILNRCRNGSDVLRNRFQQVINAASTQFSNRLIIGILPATQENINFYEQLAQIGEQALIAAGITVCGGPSWVPTQRQVIEYIRNNNAQGLNERQINYILNDVWLVQLQHQLELFARVNNGGDIQAISNLLRANFDGTHPGREQLRALVIQDLVGNEHLTNEARAQIGGVVDALPAVRVAPVQPQPVDPVQRVTQATSGNCFSNNPIKTVLGVTALGAFGYYLYTEWKKSKKKKKENKAKKAKMRKA